MPSDLTTIRNIGPATAEALMKAGITSAAELHELGADAAYMRLMETGTRPHFIGYYVLHMALQGRPWNDCQGAEKAALKARFDRLKDRLSPAMDPQIERILDQIGTGPRQV
jgi:hypothetical protein